MLGAQLSIATIAGGRKGSDMQYRGLLGLIVLVANVWAIINIFQSTADTGKKVVWTVVVFLLPVIGFILWFFLGPRTGKA
jgi:Phospholipase_D-nuclease N-terminal